MGKQRTRSDSNVLQLPIDFEQRRPPMDGRVDSSSFCLHCWLRSLIAAKGLDPDRVDDVMPLICSSGDYQAVMALIRLYLGHTTFTSDVVAANIVTLLKMNAEQSHLFRYINSNNRQRRNRRAAFAGCCNPKLRSAA